MGDSSANEYANLDQLSTEALESILRAHVESPEKHDEDYEYIEHIVEVIEQREREHPTGLLRNIDEAWAEFQTHYNTPEGEGLSLYPCDDVDQNEPVEEVPFKTTGKRKLDIMQRVSAIAAIIAAILGGMVVAQDAGLDVIGAIARWTDDVFHFTSEFYSAPTPTTIRNADAEGKLQNTLETYGIEEEVVLLSTPGLILKEVGVVENPQDCIITMTYEGDTTYLTYFIRYVPVGIKYSDSEKDTDIITVMEKNNVLHYLMSNNEVVTATWVNGNCECTMYGNISVDAMKDIINSIYD